jgi:hypothetical protein
VHRLCQIQYSKFQKFEPISLRHTAVQIMEFIFDSREELTASNWCLNCEHFCSEEMLVFGEAEVVWSVGGLETATTCQQVMHLSL